MLEPKPLVSVVIPVYKASRLIGRTLASVQAQTYQEIEILVVDDGSPDDSMDIVQEFAARDPRIRIFKQENAGVGAARNTAIRHARGKYVAPLDADDLWAPDKLERQVQCMEEGGEKIGLVYSWSVQIDEEDGVINWQPAIAIEGKIRTLLIYRNFLGNASVPLFRTTAVMEVGLYLTREEQGGAQGCEDRDLHLRIAERYEVRLVPQHAVGYRQIRHGMSVGARGMAKSHTMVMQRARERNPDVPEHIFTWAHANFYTYLSRKCYRWYDFAGSLRYARLAVAADPLLLTDGSMYMRAAKSLVRVLTGTRPPNQRPPARVTSDWDALAKDPLPAKALPLRSRLYQRIHHQRWTRLQTIEPG